MTQPEESRHKASKTKSVSKTLAILSTFDETTPMQRTSDIAMKLDMNISTMLDWGFLERDDSTGFYYPGLEIVALAGAALQNNDVFRHAFPELQRLSYKYGVHGHMGIPRKTEVAHLISSSSERTMELFIPMGHRQPMYCCAMGRALLAYMPYAKAQDILKNSDLQKRTPETKVDLWEISQELIHTKQKGYCLLLNELTEGKGSIAAPVFNRERLPIAAVSVSASAHSISQPQRERELAKAVMAVAGKISGKLGYYPK